MSKSLYELEQEMKELQQKLALVPPSHTASTFPRRDSLIARRRELEWQISELQPLLDEARLNNQLLLEKASIQTPNVESKEEEKNEIEAIETEVETEIEDVIDLVENEEELTIEEEE